MMDRSVVNSFVSMLRRIAEEHDRAKCAQLRRSLSYDPGTYFEVSPYLVPIVAKCNSEEEKRAVYLVAGCYGLWRGKITSDPWCFSEYGLSFGQAMQTALYNESKAVKESEGRRIAKFLNLDAVGLETFLPLMLGRIAKVPGLSVDWGELLEDVASWGEGSSWSPPRASSKWIHPSRRWAEDFWAPKIFNPSKNASADRDMERQSFVTDQKDIAV